MPDSPESWRCFVAVPVPEAQRAGLAAAVDQWRSEADAPNLRWTDPAGWHITLAFLGATDPGTVDGLRDALAVAVRGAVPFTVATAHVGAFPRPASAQSVWLGVADPDGRLTELAVAVQAAVLPLDQRRPLRAHLTLGRSRARRGEPLGPWLASRSVPPTEFPVDAVVLFRSHLGRGPARYDELARVPVGGAGSSGG